MLPLLLVFAVQAALAEVGSAACKACHAVHFERQSATGHARALSLPSAHPMASKFSALVDFKPEWAFGGGQQAVTFVSRVRTGAYIEHGLSYYTSLGRMDATPGHAAAKGPGVLYPVISGEAEILRCFQCHSTGQVRVGEGLRISVTEPGVRCESCHGPGEKHVFAPGLGNVVNPASYSAAEMNQACGSCHRKPAAAGDNTDWNDPWNTRHQPLYLAESACFLKSEGKLSCGTCHDVHGGGAAKPSCGGCHVKPRHAAATAVVGKKCQSCHMPVVVPRPGLAFANHWIGVYAPGRPLRPIARGR